MKLASVVVFALAAVRPLAAADWPQYGADAQRRGVVADTLPGELELKWKIASRAAPRPAWPRSDRMTFDRAYHAVAAAGRVFYGSSADHTIRCVDAKDGAELWSYFTDGPVRFAPAVWRDRVFAVSDDGCLYCLSAADGRLIYRLRGGPGERMLLGNEQMTSRWPARGAPAIVDDTVYFAAGVWPSDGIFLYAIDAESGEVVWCNDDSGAIYMPQPHGGANAQSGVSAQGCLVAAGDRLLIPTGRAVPAVFSRDDGSFQYFHLQRNGHRGGAGIVAGDELFFNGGLAFQTSDGESFADVGAGPLAVAGDELIRGDAGGVGGYEWTEVEKPDRKGKLVKHNELKARWRSEKTPAGTALAVADNVVVASGGDQVTVVDRATHAPVWRTTVDGTARGLAIADGQLYVSTEAGTIYCFGKATGAEPIEHSPAQPAAPYANDSPAALAAERILQSTGVHDGLCVDLGAGDGALAYHLARLSNLQIWAVDPDAANVAAARRKLEAAGLYGTRVTVHQGGLDAANYPKYFANLVVSAAALDGGDEGLVDAEETLRLTRPFGGAICMGSPDALATQVRGPLEGAGSWTHQYADAGNTCCTTDTLVRGQLGMLWFRDVDLDVPQRHGRGPAPLYYEGRLYMLGLDELACVDAYNGRPLWRRAFPGILTAYDSDHLMGTAGTGSPMCIAPEGLFVRTADRCLRLDPATGDVLTRFETPKRADGQAGVWGYVACDGGVLFGSLADVSHIVNWRFRQGDMSQLFTESTELFAFDAESGELKWRFTPKNSIRHNAIAVGDGRIYVIDRPQALMDRLDVRRGKIEAPKEHAPGELLAIDADSGKVVWSTDDRIHGTMLALSSQHDALLMSHQRTRFELDSEKTGAGLAVFEAENGRRLWDNDAQYASRPLINDRTIYAQGGGWDLLTGEPRAFNFERSYGCGVLAGCENMMVFRSATLGYFDLQKNEATENYGGLRPGCWINAIPAGGMVLVPDASAGCQCSYLNRAWIALEPAVDGAG